MLKIRRLIEWIRNDPKLGMVEVSFGSEKDVKFVFEFISELETEQEEVGYTPRELKKRILQFVPESCIKCPKSLKDDFIVTVPIRQQKLKDVKDVESLVLYFLSLRSLKDLDFKIFLGEYIRTSLSFGEENKGQITKILRKLGSKGFLFTWIPSEEKRLTILID